MIALEVSSAGRPGTHGGVPGAVRNLVGALLRTDPGTQYALCVRLSRRYKGYSLDLRAENACHRVLCDPLNGLVLNGATLLHSMGIFLPQTPRIPKLVTVHDLNAVRNTQWVRPEWHERRSGRIRAVVARADHVVTYSQFTAQEVQEEFDLPADRVSPVALGVDTSAFRPPAEAEIRALRAVHGDYALAIGLLTPRKNFPALVDAVAQLPDLRLLIVGRPSDGSEALAQAIERHGMAQRVQLLQNLSGEELVHLIGAARVFAVPSLYEGFGLTALEAMACGTPVVCSRNASLPEVTGDAALMVDARSSESLADALRRVVMDAELAQQLRERGLARAKEFSWENSAAQMRALYRRLS